MSYCVFTIEEVKRRFLIRLEENYDRFSIVPPAKISPLLREILKEYVPLGLAIATEKARSEMIIAPVLIEVRRELGEKVSLFSGVDFTVDQKQGVSGVSDLLLSRSPEQWTVEAPVISVVEARNENVEAGIAQCLAQMVGARLFNEQNGKVLEVVYGVVTTGSIWRFLRLKNDETQMDRTEYYMNEVGRILGILRVMLDGTAG